ncbi:hypothetical protein KAF25_010457 [Fusarium avenaceum]|uniref:Xylanolytic transcriptional activator regulatory domain-containing protein n=1 Tax=Fusarium avenaceum TaxID=40199 RepID=A0A9P7KNW6_9HYPO|nr:hypothetical protein KAF25_010457 [Fusarium avenaceum]
MVQQHKYVILGAGVIGLTTAIELKTRRPSADVTILAKELPGDTDASYSSAWAGANWVSCATDNGLEEEWDRVTYLKFGKLSRSSPESGVRRMNLRSLYDEEKEKVNILSQSTQRIWYDDLVQGIQYIDHEELPQGAKFGFEISTFVLDTPKYLSWLQRELVGLGAKIRRATVDDIRTVPDMVPGTSVIFNCIGLGAFSLGGVADPDVYPSKGQIILAKAPLGGISKMYFRSNHRLGTYNTHVFPRGKDAVVLGGCKFNGDWSPEFDEAVGEEIKRRCCALVPELGKPEDLEVIEEGVGLRLVMPDQASTEGENKPYEEMFPPPETDYDLDKPMDVKWGLRRDLVGFGDPHFSMFLRKVFIKALGYGEDALSRPIVGIINTQSAFNPCHANSPQMIEAIKRGVQLNGGIALDFPTISLAEVFSFPTSLFLRNLMSMDTEEMIRAQPVDSVIAIGGCDNTIPAQIMGGISANKPVLNLVTGPMMPGSHRGRRVGACTDCRNNWASYRAGHIDMEDISTLNDELAPTIGFCGVMGTASTMACIAGSLGLMPLNGATAPAVSATRMRIAEQTGVLAMKAIYDNRTPQSILSVDSFYNAITVLQAIGGSTNCVVHMLAMANRHPDVAGKITLDTIDEIGRKTPLLIDLKPSGDHYMTDFHEAGGLAVLFDNLRPLLKLDAKTITGETLGEHITSSMPYISELSYKIIRPMSNPLYPHSSLVVLRGNIAAGGAIMKPSASKDRRLLSHRGRAVVFSNPTDMANRVDDPDLEVDEDSILVLQGIGPIGNEVPGMPEAGLLPIPRKLASKGVIDMLRISDGRMSGTAGGSVVLHVSPEATLAESTLGVLRTGDWIVCDVEKRLLHVEVSDTELDQRRAERAASKEKQQAATDSGLKPRKAKKFPTRGYRGLRVERLQQAIGAPEDRDSGFDRISIPANGQQDGLLVVSPTLPDSAARPKDTAANNDLCSTGLAQPFKIAQDRVFNNSSNHQSNHGFLNARTVSERNPSENPESIRSHKSAMVPETLHSGSDAFGTEIQSVLAAQAQLKPGTGSSCSLPLGSPHQVDPSALANLQRWPSEEEAQDLFELVIINFGVSHQLFDIRSVSENISRLYYNTANNISLQGLWFVQVLFILAIGRLLQAGAGEGDEVPGSALFNEGKKHLPQMDEIRGEKISSIELYGLGATFLQISDRKEEAYLYASTALRLAISYGLHRKDRIESHSRFDAVHYNRLWWSTYMQERRLAAAGGFPASITDESITAPLPADVVGFPSAAPIRVNVQTAQIPSLTISTVYSQTKKSESGFSKEVQNIFHCLNDIESMISPDSTLTMSSSGLFIAGRPFNAVSPTHAKTSSSHYLVIHQATMLAIRPILLHLARKNHHPNEVQNMGQTSQVLASRGIEATKKSLVILQNLRETELLSKNTFMELDVLFSSGFMFVLLQAIHPGTGHGRVELEQTRELLEYLVGVGNRAAAKHSCQDSLNIGFATESNTPHPAENGNQTAACHATEQSIFGFSPGSNGSSSQLVVSNDRMNDINTHTGITQEMGLGNVDLESIILRSDNGLYEMYSLPDLVFTGTEKEDWAALGY